MAQLPATKTIRPHFSSVLWPLLFTVALISTLACSGNPADNLSTKQLAQTITAQAPQPTPIQPGTHTLSISPRLATNTPTLPTHTPTPTTEPSPTPHPPEQTPDPTTQASDPPATPRNTPKPTKPPLRLVIAENPRLTPTPTPMPTPTPTRPPGLSVQLVTPTPTTTGTQNPLNPNPTPTTNPEVQKLIEEAKILAEQGQLEQASTTLQRASDLAHRKDANIHTLLAEILRKRQRHDQALNHHDLAVSLDPNPKHLAERALTHMTLGNLQKASTDAHQVLTRPPHIEPGYHTSAQAHIILARYHSLNGHRQNTIHHLQQAIRLIKQHGYPQEAVNHLETQLRDIQQR